VCVHDYSLIITFADLEADIGPINGIHRRWRKRSHDVLLNCRSASMLAMTLYVFFEFGSQRAGQPGSSRVEGHKQGCRQLRIGQQHRDKEDHKLT
jgi:hypothetical protein